MNQLTVEKAQRIFEAMFKKWNDALAKSYENIEKVNLSYPKGTRGRDAAMLKAVAPIVACYTKTAILMPTLQNELCTTPEEIGKYFIHFAEKNPKGVIIGTSTIKLAENGNEILAAGNYDFNLKDPKTKEKSTAHCNYLYTVVKDKESGEWKWATHVSRLHPQPAPTAPVSAQKPEGPSNHPR